MIQTHWQVEAVRALLEDYAQRGVFRGFCAGGARRGKAAFRMIWHRNRPFELIVDSEQGELRFANILPNVPADSAMYRDLKKYVKQRHHDALPEHRRIDQAKAQVRTYNRQGNVSLVLKLTGDDFEYGTRKLVHLVQEIFLDFLVEGTCLEYTVETFELDPDHI